MSDTVHVKEHLIAGKEYTRNITSAIAPTHVKEIGKDAVKAQKLLQKLMTDDGHEILGYELVIRVIVRAGGEADGEGPGQGASGDDGA